MKFQTKFILTLSLTVINALYVAAQPTMTNAENVSDLKSAIDSLITNNLYEDLDSELQIFFVLKVDSVGHILSAHIVKSKNLVLIPFHLSYELCRNIEDRIKAKFLYEYVKYRRETMTAMPFDDKYHRINYNYKKSAVCRSG